MPFFFQKTSQQLLQRIDCSIIENFYIWKMATQCNGTSGLRLLMGQAKVFVWMVLVLNQILLVCNVWSINIKVVAILERFCFWGGLK